MKNSNMEIPVTFKDPLEQWNEFDLEEKKLNKNYSDCDSMPDLNSGSDSADTDSECNHNSVSESDSSILDSDSENKSLTNDMFRNSSSKLLNKLSTAPVDLEQVLADRVLLQCAKELPNTAQVEKRNIQFCKRSRMGATSSNKHTKGK